MSFSMVPALGNLVLCKQAIQMRLDKNQPGNNGFEKYRMHWPICSCVWIVRP